jgi:hypothetical protein
MGIKNKENGTFPVPFWDYLGNEKRLKIKNSGISGLFSHSHGNEMGTSQECLGNVLGMSWESNGNDILMDFDMIWHEICLMFK